MSVTRDEADQMAIDFLAKAGSDCVGVIDSDEKLAAAMIYDQLRRDGLVLATIGASGPVYRLSKAGWLRAASPTPPDLADGSSPL